MSHKKANKNRKPSRGTTTLKQHKQVKKTLLPPLMQLPVSLSSWADGKLPEMIWLDCLLMNFEFNQAGGIFHKTLDIIDEFIPVESKEVVTGLVSSFSLVPGEGREEARRVLHEEGLDEAVFPEAFKHAISLYPDCPMDWLFEDWRPDTHIDPEIGINYLKEAVRRLFASRSKHSARCRMFGLARMAKHGRIHVSVDVKDTLDLLCDYSDDMPEDLQQQVEASVRSMFGAIFNLSDGEARAWAPHFWRHNYKISICEKMKETPNGIDGAEMVRAALKKLRESLAALKTAYQQATAKADLDLFAPDRDEVLFGLVSRQFRLFSVITGDPNLWSPDLGHMLHRVMADNLIVLAYLIHKNEPALFERFKRYSLGKQKLYKLHLSDYGERMGLDMSEVEEELEERINEEIFEEFLPIELGSVFEGMDTRKMAYEVKLEDLYRLVYSPTSAELHGEWVSLKEHNLTLCVNPLHRFHRLPRLESKGMLSTGIVLMARSILADTVTGWFKAYKLEVQYESVIETFREDVVKAFEDHADTAAASATTS